MHSKPTRWSSNKRCGDSTFYSFWSKLQPLSPVALKQSPCVISKCWSNSPALRWSWQAGTLDHGLRPDQGQNYDTETLSLPYLPPMLLPPPRLDNLWEEIRASTTQLTEMGAAVSNSRVIVMLGTDNWHIRLRTAFQSSETCAKSQNTRPSSNCPKAPPKNSADTVLSCMPGKADERRETPSWRSGPSVCPGRTGVENRDGAWMVEHRDGARIVHGERRRQGAVEPRLRHRVVQRASEGAQRVGLREWREVSRWRAHRGDARGYVEDLDRAPAGLLMELVLCLHLCGQDSLLVRSNLVVGPGEACPEGAPAVATPLSPLSLFFAQQHSQDTEYPSPCACCIQCSRSTALSVTK